VQPRLKLWVEDDGRLLLSDFRVGLLQAVHETGSVSAAAQRHGLSYRRAWGKIKELEANLGLPLVVSTTGGKCGGSTRLTATGRTLVSRYAAFRVRVEQAMIEAFTAVFTEDSDSRVAAPLSSTAEATPASPRGR
jgi:molybdate transport system regulatory protein